MFQKITLVRFAFFVLGLLLSLVIQSDTVKPKLQTYQNRLAFEKSPYLLQHADNPVDWYPWGEEAFQKAQAEDKPIFLSIGYSTCHWCHVMEHESFEDVEVARQMNETFVSIKVDREERPDIDNIYMTVCQLMTGGGGWPLTVLLMPDKTPFFAGTYFPKSVRAGHPGVLELTARVRELWAGEREKLAESATQITEGLKQIGSGGSGKDLGREDLQVAFDHLKQSFDPVYGGFGRAPKFPTPHRLTFLLRYWNHTKDKGVLAMVEKTLQEMRKGGIYDHLGFGFHRYSTDAEWHEPHYEKMLYDQSLLSLAYLEAYQATEKKEYADTAREIFDYVLRDMSSPDGGFYSAEDADSEGVEGKFYLWTGAEIRKILSQKEADLIITHFGIDESQVSTLHLHQEPSDSKVFASARKKLFEHRKSRVPPYKDDKILTDWNGLMIAALARGARVLQNPSYAEAARHAAHFLLKLRRRDGRLLHRFRDGKAEIPAYIDDYAFLTWGLIELYEATFEVDLLKEALLLNQEALKHFWDAEKGGFFFTAADAEKLLVRQKEIYDGAVPSGNSVAMLNLLRLSRLTGDKSLEEKAVQLGRSFSEGIRRSPSAHAQTLQAVDFLTGPSYEVVIVGQEGAEDTQAMLQVLAKTYLPTALVLFKPEGKKSDKIKTLAPFTEFHKSLNGHATAYVCQNFTCQSPTTDISKMLSFFQR